MSGILQLPHTAQHGINWKRLLIILALAMLVWAALTYAWVAITLVVIATLALVCLWYVRYMQEAFTQYRRIRQTYGSPATEEQIQEDFWREMNQGQRLLQHYMPGAL